MIARDEPHCLFLDERNTCSQEVQKTFYSLILERRVGEYYLPQGSMVIGAGNRAQDNTITRPVSSALLNRMFHLELRADTRLWLEWAAQNGNGAGRCGPTGRSRSSRHSHLGTGPQVDAAVPQLPVSPDALPTFPAHHRALIPAGGTEFLTIEGTQFGDGVLLVAEISEKGVPHLESPPTKYSTAKKRLVYRFSCSSVRPRSGLNQTGRSTGRRDRR